MIQNILVLGAGSAGLLTAITLKKKLPQLTVRIVRSSDFGVIGVGEGTTPAMPRHLFGYLGIKPGPFYARAEPTWKLGIRFLWGPRDHFDYTFTHQLDAQWDNLPRPNGFYSHDEFRATDLNAALMAQGKAFARNPKGGGPDMSRAFGFHIENKKLVETLETTATELGVTFVEGKVSGTERGPDGFTALQLEDGQRLEADFFVDCSGFRSELLGRALAEPFVSYDRALFCDRAVIGGWDRTTEPILPYTTAETMEAGWAWQIEHEHHINRGYVYCSQAISDEDACAEFQRKNPKAPATPRVVKFRSGRYQRVWVDNVVAIGNSAGFVEPLEATALMVVTQQCEHLIAMLQHTTLQPTPTVRALYNKMTCESFDDTRDFLALHYKLNTRLDNEFWRHCVADTDMGSLGPLLEFYRENGPTGIARYTLPSLLINFGIEGYLVMLVGNQAPYHARHQPTPAEQSTWAQNRAPFMAQARQGMTVAEALRIIRLPQWNWNA